MFNGENQNPSGENGNDTKNYRDRGRITNKVIVDQKAVEPGSGNQSDDLRAQQEAYQKEIVARFEQKLAEMKRQQSGASSPDQSSANAGANVSSDTANRINQGMRKNSGMKGFIAAGAAVGLAATIGFLAIGNKNTTQPSTQTVSTEAFAASPATEAASPENTVPEATVPTSTYDEFAAMGFETWGDTAERKGVVDGYGEYGMWSSGNKPSDYAFASAVEVAKACNNDDVEMVKYTAKNQVESFADYLANLPERLQPEGFKGLDLLSTERKLESLSEEEYASVQEQFNQIMDRAFTRRVVLDGEYQNAYMRLKDASGGVTHENMELVACTTSEHGLEVTEFYWTEDDNGNSPEIGTMDVKITRDEEGNVNGGCDQVVKEKGSSDVYNSLTEVEDPGTGSEGTGDENTGSESTGGEGTGSEGTGSEGTGSEGTGSEGTGSEGTGSEGTGSEGTGYEGTGDEGTGSETTELVPKDEEAEIANAGDHVERMEVDPNQATSEAEHETVEAANRESVEQQAADDAAAAAAAEETRRQQEAAEQEAAAAAEKRRQEEAAAEEARRQQEAAAAAAAAAQQAAEQQAAANAAAQAAEEQRRQEEAARQAAQQAADEAAAAAAETAPQANDSSDFEKMAQEMGF